MIRLSYFNLLIFNFLTKFKENEVPVVMLSRLQNIFCDFTNIVRLTHGIKMQSRHTEFQ